MNVQKLKRLALTLVLSISPLAPAQAGGEGLSGGGDEFTLDFVRTATQFIVPWLKSNESKLKPSVNIDTFVAAIQPMYIVSQPHVFESCDGTLQGREVEACYNSASGKIFLSRSLYPLKDEGTPAKLGLIAHELFRKLGLEGDDYKLTRQIFIASVPRVLCNVTEYYRRSEKEELQAKTSVHSFDGSLQVRSIPLSYLKTMSVTLQGAPGSVGDSRAFVLSAKIVDLKTGASSFSQAWFVESKEYLESNHDAVAGSLRASHTRGSGEKIAVSCFNPRAE